MTEFSATGAAALAWKSELLALSIATRCDARETRPDKNRCCFRGMDEDVAVNMNGKEPTPPTSAFARAKSGAVPGPPPARRWWRNPQQWLMLTMFLLAACVFGIRFYQSQQVGVATLLARLPNASQGGGGSNLQLAQAEQRAF